MVRGNRPDSGSDGNVACPYGRANFIWCTTNRPSSRGRIRGSTIRYPLTSNYSCFSSPQYQVLGLVTYVLYGIIGLMLIMGISIFFTSSIEGEMSNPLRRLLSLAVVKVMFISIVLTLAAVADAEARRVSWLPKDERNVCAVILYQELSLKLAIPISRKRLSVFLRSLINRL